MKTLDNEKISALVVLKPPVGNAPGPTSEITSRTLDKYRPSVETAARASASFERLGFEVGPLVGVAFSISGTPGLFRKVFDVQLELTEDHAVICVDGDGVAGSELPASALPSELGRLVVSVYLEPPAELM